MDLATREGFTQLKLTDLTPGKELCFEKDTCFSQIRGAKSHFGKFRPKKRGKKMPSLLTSLSPPFPLFSPWDGVHTYG